MAWKETWKESRKRGVKLGVIGRYMVDGTMQSHEDDLCPLKLHPWRRIQIPDAELQGVSYLSQSIASSLLEQTCPFGPVLFRPLTLPDYFLKNCLRSVGTFL